MGPYSKIPAAPKWMFDYNDIDIIQNDANQLNNDYKETLVEGSRQYNQIKDEAQQKEDAFNEAMGYAYQNTVATKGLPTVEDYYEMQREAYKNTGDLEGLMKTEQELDKRYRLQYKQEQAERSKSIKEQQKAAKEADKERKQALKDGLTYASKFGTSAYANAPGLTPDEKAEYLLHTGAPLQSGKAKGGDADSIVNDILGKSKAERLAELRRKKEQQGR